MGKSIFEFAEKMGYESPWDEDWTKTDFSGSTGSSNNSDTKQTVQKYTHPDKTSFTNATDKARRDRHKTYKEYKAYYEKIGKLKPGATEKEIWDSFSVPNKTELNRFEDVIHKNEDLYTAAVAEEKQWNKLDSEIENVTHDFNGRKKISGSDRLNPSFVKAIMFSETEIGAGAEYKRLVEYVSNNEPRANYQLNLGRVTDESVYDSVVKEFNITVSKQTNYKDFGNKNDVMLCVGALFQKREYAIKVPTSFYTGDKWFNALVAFKGASNEGKGKAKLAYKLYEDGTHPYSDKKLF